MSTVKISNQQHCLSLYQGPALCQLLQPGLSSNAYVESGKFSEMSDLDNLT